MIDYEILLLLDPDLAEERQGEILARLRDQIEKGGGTFERHDQWGRRRLAYEIDKKTDGTYHLTTFSCAPETLDEISRVLRIDDGVLRHMATRRIETGPGQTLSVSGPSSEDMRFEPAADLDEEE
jgi:small subunit ribosomal protein S6